MTALLSILTMEQWRRSGKAAEKPFGAIPERHRKPRCQRVAKTLMGRCVLYAMPYHIYRVERV